VEVLVHEVNQVVEVVAMVVLEVALMLKEVEDQETHLL
tara:strand:- start:402 stop:515 length:114 start_codon:yes stop_codon:yes gene_type:complete